MKRLLLRSSAFVRTARRLVKKDPEIATDLQSTFELLSEDAFNPKLRTHKLKGSLTGSWACAIGYDCRIVFKFVRYQDAEAILLESIGSHEEVY
jgi:addiction module RelE/StbE family toxin